MCSSWHRGAERFLFEFLRLNIALAARASSNQLEEGLCAITWGGSDGDNVQWWRSGKRPLHDKVTPFLGCTCPY